MVPLHQLVSFVGGGTPSKAVPHYWTGTIPWVSPKDMTRSEIDSAQDSITESAISGSSASLIPTGSILVVVRSGILVRTIPIAITQVPLAINQDLKALIPLKGVVQANYLRYFLERSSQRILLAYVKRGATVHSIDIGKFKQMAVPLRALSEQIRISEIVAEADALRQARSRADALAFRLVPSLLLNTFGDPVSNQKRWPVHAMSEFFRTDRHGPKCGPFGSALKKHEYTKTGIPVWGIDNILPNRFVERNSLFISEDKFSELTSYSVQPGDVLISRAGTVGRMCVARPTNPRSIIGTNLIRLSFDPEALAPEYFAAVFTYFPQITSRFRAASDDGAYSFMNTAVLRSIQIPVPPIELQRRFASWIQEIRTLQERQVTSKDNLERLFNSLLAIAFDGDLTAKWRETRMEQLLEEMRQQLRLIGSLNDHFAST